MAQLQLEGQVQDQVDDRDQTIHVLEQAIQAMGRKFDQVEEQLRSERNRNSQIEHGVRELRHILNPLYRALQKIYGQMDDMGAFDGPSGSNGSAANPRTNPKWESWKSKMPGRPAEFIDLLLLHGTMNRNQLMAAAHCGKDVVRVTISKLNVAGLLNKNGGQYSLKEL